MRGIFPHPPFLPVKYWKMPTWLSGRKLKAKVLVKLTPQGRILSTDFVERSGNPDFDLEVLKAIERADPVPAPPKDLADHFLANGEIWDFGEE